MSATAQPLFTDFAAAPRSTTGGVETATLLAANQSDGRSQVEEINCSARGSLTAIGNALHHRYIYVLEGDWTIVVGGDAHNVSAGTTLVAPRGTACGGTVTGAGAGRLLMLTFSGLTAISLLRSP